MAQNDSVNSTANIWYTQKRISAAGSTMMALTMALSLPQHNSRLTWFYHNTRLRISQNEHAKRYKPNWSRRWSYFNLFEEKVSIFTHILLILLACYTSYFQKWSKSLCLRGIFWHELHHIMIIDISKNASEAIAMSGPNCRCLSAIVGIPLALTNAWVFREGMWNLTFANFKMTFIYCTRSNVTYESHY